MSSIGSFAPQMGLERTSVAQQLIYGPDRAVRPARFHPPPGACDVHAHVYGPASRFPYPGNPKSPPRPDAIFEDYMKMHEVLGIEVTGNESKIEKFLMLMGKFGISELSRTGRVALARKPN